METDAPPGPRLYATRFWGDGDKGLDALGLRLKAAKHASEDTLAMLKERASLEDEHGKKLLKLAKGSVGRDEVGSLRDALDGVKAETEAAGRAHQSLAAQIRSECEKPLAERHASLTAERRGLQARAEKTLRAKATQAVLVAKLRAKYEARCLDAQALGAQGHPQENSEGAQGSQATPPDRSRAKLDKSQQAVRASDRDYIQAVDILLALSRKWEADFADCCQQCQILDEERIASTRSTLWTFANLLSALCVAVDESCERVRQTLEHVDTDADLQLVVAKYGTGADIPKPLEYVNFYTGTSTPLAVAGAGADCRRLSVASLDYKPGTPLRGSIDSSVSPSKNSSISGDLHHQPPVPTQEAAYREVYPPAEVAVHNLSLHDSTPPAPAPFHYDPWDVPPSLPVLFSGTPLPSYFMPS